MHKHVASATSSRFGIGKPTMYSGEWVISFRYIENNTDRPLREVIHRRDGRKNYLVYCDTNTRVPEGLEARPVITVLSHNDLEWWGPERGYTYNRVDLCSTNPRNT